MAGQCGKYCAVRIPEFDCSIVAARGEQGLGAVGAEVDAIDSTCMSGQGFEELPIGNAPELNGFCPNWKRLGSDYRG